MNEEQVMDDEELVFNPEQDADEKRELRRGYRELQRTTDGAWHDSCSCPKDPLTR